MSRVLEGIATASRTRSRITPPRRLTARIPDRCVRCGRGHPGSTARLIARDDRAGRRLASGWFHVRAINGVGLDEPAGLRDRPRTGDPA